MNQHRQLQKSKLHELKEQAEKARKKALRLCREISPLIDPTLQEVVEMDIAGAASAMDELVLSQAELLSLDIQIENLEEALYS